MATAVATDPRTQAASSLRPAAQPRKRIAFVCWGNSCRSQMAEAWARHLGRDAIQVMSAGLAPLGYITPETIQVMEEKNVSLAGQHSKGISEIDWQQVDLLVNMTGLPGYSVAPGFRGQRLDWKVPDPFDESLRVYRRVRDQLERKVRHLLADLEKSSCGGPAAPSAS